MNKFYTTGFAFAMHEVSRAKVAFVMIEQTGGGATKPSGRPAEIMENVLNDFSKVVPSDMRDCVRAFHAAKSQWEDSLLNVSRAAQIASRLEDDLVAGTMDRQFLWIAADRQDLIDKEDLFGTATQFPSAADDLKEAGNCLAAECTTACIFHLMRAAEVALRALAKDREVEFADKPIDQQEWGTILTNLDSKIKQLREDNLKNWASGVKDIQLRFYGEVVQELRGFNEAWRRHLSHAREDAFYDRDYAADTMKHVRKFMKKLATKISENTITPKYWTNHEAGI